MKNAEFGLIDEVKNDKGFVAYNLVSPILNPDTPYNLSTEKNTTEVYSVLCIEVIPSKILK